MIIANKTPSTSILALRQRSQNSTAFTGDQSVTIFGSGEAQGARYTQDSIRALRQRSQNSTAFTGDQSATIFGSGEAQGARYTQASIRATMQRSLNQKAFTLVEVLFAMMIMAGVLLAISGTWSGTLNSQKKSEKMQLISSLMKSKITELELKYSKLTFNEIPEEDGGDFGTDVKDLSWTVEVKLLKFPDLRPLMTADQDQVDERLLTVVKQMTDHFSKNTKEMKLTIVWNAGKKKVEYSATTYIVNYSGGLPTPGGS